MCRLVEAELLLELLDELWIEALRAPILGTHLVLSRLGLGTRRQRVALRAANAGRGRNVSAGDLRDHPLDRPARRELNDGKADQHDPEQGRDDQQDAFQQVGGHRRTAWLASV